MAVYFTQVFQASTAVTLKAIVPMDVPILMVWFTALPMLPWMNTLTLLGDVWVKTFYYRFDLTFKFVIFRRI